MIMTQVIKKNSSTNLVLNLVKKVFKEHICIYVERERETYIAIYRLGFASETSCGSLAY